MDARLRSLIQIYQASVARAVKLLCERVGIAKLRSPLELLSLPGRGQLSEGASYWRHGRGYEVTFSDVVVDFDFGESGEIDGLDSYKLQDFARRQHHLVGFKAQEEIRDTFQSAVDTGALVRFGHLWYVKNRDV